MKKLWSLFLVLCLIISFAGCTQKKGDDTSNATSLDTSTEAITEPTTEKSGSDGQNWTAYTFDDNEQGVKFSIEYPENWVLIEQKAQAGAENQEGSRSTGVQFVFNEDEKEMFSILAMLVAPFELDESLFKSEPFETTAGLSGTKYTKELDGQILAYFIFGSGDTLPHYIGVINMTSTSHEANKDTIDRVMKTLKILTE